VLDHLIIPSKALGRLIFTGQRQIGAACSWSFDFCSLEVTLISSLKKDSNASTGDICSATPCHRQDHKPVEYVAPEILFICVSFEYTVLRFGITINFHLPITNQFTTTPTRDRFQKIQYLTWGTLQEKAQLRRTK